MADETPPHPPARQMSLIPYANDSREIVLRRGNAVVVYDAHSRQLSVGNAADQPVELADCPYCHRPLRDRDSSGGDEDHNRSFGPERPFLDPDYFAMLMASQHASPAASGSSTPSRRVHPAIQSGRSRQASADTGPPTGAEFVASEPSNATGQGISQSAFSPGFFQQFFREERELGRGGNGVVLLVEHVIDGVSLGHFACKRIPVGDSRAYFEKVIVEVRLLQKIPHKNLVAYHWTWLEDHQPSRFGPSVPCLWILQEYCNGGDLHSYVIGPQEVQSTTDKVKDRFRRMSRGDSSPPHEMRGPSKLAFDEIFSFFRDITSGLHHLHSKGYIHRDLKPSNCLLQRDGARTRVLISDFGEVQAAGSTRGSSGATGTISYCAPEVLQRTRDGTFGNFTTKSDIFSLGMIVYFMCFGRLPYINADSINEENDDLDELRAEITKWSGFNNETRLRSDLPERLYKFLKKLLSVEPSERPSTDEILASIKGGASLSEADSSADEYSSRVSSIDSPAPKPSSRNRRQSYIARPGLNSAGRHSSSESIGAKSSVKHDRSRPTSPLDSALAVGHRKIDVPPSAAATRQSSRPSSPLMLPPPPERPIVTWIHQLVHDPRSALVLRAAIFLAKMSSLFVPCAPYATNPWLMYPLLALASLDLGLLPFGVRQSVILMGAHSAFILIASQHSRLCEAGGIISWEHI